MIAYCWATGLIEFGDQVPEGALSIASGAPQLLRAVISVRARHGKGASEGKLLVPGVPEAPSDQAKGDALQAWLAWCAQLPKGLRWSAMADSPSQPQTTEAPHVHA